MDPQVLMQLSQLIQQLPPEQLNQMQTLMHNAMAGLDVRVEMEAFEKNLPPGFREKMMTLMAGQMGAMGSMGTLGKNDPIDVTPLAHGTHEPSSPMDLHNARNTVLRAVADGRMTPEEAEKLLFPG
jgi:hypothetical protein